MKKFLLNIALILLFCTTSVAQQKYWIYFNDKTKTDYTAEGDYYDRAINQVFLDSLQQLNLHVIQKSKWLNAVTALLTEEQQLALNHLGFVKKISPVRREIRVLSVYKKTYDTNLALKQINADTLINLGLSGKGIKIGLIDGGFLRADEDDRLKPIIDSGRLLAYRNFIEKDIQDPFTGTKKHDDDHGTAVWALTGGYDRSSNKYHGLASQSDYYLARTDQGDKEYRGEEDHWIAALEWMHDQGVKLVNSSLGYSNGYDDPLENYTPQDVDGQTSAITQAATIAALKKDMILVISAGNDGINDFEIISIPADAEGILSVGATGFSTWRKQHYSSTGPEGLPYIKPEISCYSSYGTSFSAPIITGLIAGILQAAPDLSGREVVDLIKQSGHLYRYPNNYVGYGVPDARRVLGLLGGHKSHVPTEQVLAISHKVTLPLTGNNIVAFHKKDQHHVIAQQTIKTGKNNIEVTRPANAVYTTVASPEKVYEIIWP
ncbi:putative exported serine protease, subtilase family [Fulvivirga imtechensis AK7]|uniref:Putative exported serine protease, subtilase family n=1 Tax=Fulvivirga imtechensis AK7 TaxID=1237149 RepID=L8JMJ4_9BACT|nr:S8 family serine peptidase [Fulvivirga imtechensis]ELR69448.1 putative exported serine protease, subtilase family [Fulvivirga imtechensis AK7]